uniref:BHLH domain-containing protein n=1 Tax=Kalanchoe fedtschenkoi TaxID=63787 RepID=A0A7N0ZVZ2_KALFE
MELSQPFLLEEWLAMKRENCSTYQTGVEMSEFYTDGWSCDFIDEPQALAASTDVAMGTATGFAMPQMEPYFDVPFSEVYNTLDACFDAPAPAAADQFNLAYEINNGATLLPPIPDQNTSMMDEDFTFFSNDCVELMKEDKHASGCKVEMVLSPNENLGSSTSKMSGGGRERRNGAKKAGGQPSKNLMAERRRRKRLNDRLSMLRSIVPRISKMDRTSILADTIDYMKELIEKVSKLEEEEEEHTEAGPINKLKELKSSEGQAKNSPKFDVKMGEKDTRIDICCTTRPGLLLTTVNTLEALGLEIQQCVISCFNDFSMQAACSQVYTQQVRQPNRIQL